MRKRLQKKYELGPYKRFGFDITGKFVPNADKEKIMCNLYDFLSQHGMSGSIGYHLTKDNFDLYIDVGTRKMKPVQQKKIVLDWFEKRTDLSSFEAGELHDINDKLYRD